MIESSIRVQKVQWFKSSRAVVRKLKLLEHLELLEPLNP